MNKMIRWSSYIVGIQLLIMVNYGTTVTKAVVKVVPVLLSQSFHSYGTSVTMPL